VRGRTRLSADVSPMSERIPIFRYHPDPIATGAVTISDKSCVCCGLPRGYIYSGPVYGERDLQESLCPWCIASGDAAEQLGASFADGRLLTRAGVAAEIVEEVHLRTPGYNSWQGEQWLWHCEDACEFHGDASTKDVCEASEETKRQWAREYRQDEERWKRLTTGYRPGGDSALYKFVCRHCGLVLFGWDLS
jgi:uncharacterized protein